MALTRISRRVRPLVAVAAAAGTAAALLLPGVASATPDPAQPPAPTIQSVTSKLGTLAKQNEALTEKYNQAQAEVARTQNDAQAARKTAARAAATYQAARARLDRALTAQYEGSAFSATGALLTSPNGQTYLDKLSSLTLLSAHRASVLSQVRAARKDAQRAQENAAALFDKAKKNRDAVAKQRDQIIADTGKYKDLLATLTAQQQAAYRARNAVANTPAQVKSVQSTITVHAGNTAAQKAVNFALAQVGKAYQFAASGPDAFDCSGLTMAAWAQAGVSLPHLASAQYNYGTHVSVDQLQPGDLIFLYQPITHVEIYIGNGMAVSAADEAEGIVIVNISRDMGDWAGATRLT